MSEDQAQAQPEDILAMSDEDIMNMPEPGSEPSQEAPEEELAAEAGQEQALEDEPATEDDPDAIEQGVEQGHEPTAENGEQAEELDEEPEGDPKQEQAEAAEDPEGGESDPVAKKEEDPAKEEEAAALSSDELLKSLFTPFKANGKDMQVSNIEDARTLMQMGANYNKKMQGLKPNLRLMKMLDNNKLLDEEKLSYLIDLSNNNPEAIAKLVKDSGIDAYELTNDDEKKTEYKPGTYTVDDKEVELDQVLQGIEDSPTFQETIDIISTKWDTASKTAVRKSPDLIATINDHVASGIYEQISTIVEQEKLLGRLPGMSDLEAYYFIGDSLNKQGAFNQQPQDEVNLPTPIVKPQEDPKLKAKKRAASSTKTTPRKTKPMFNPLELSDEEFMKATAPI